MRGARPGDGPARAVIDSRAVGPGDLFVGLPGERADGGAFAADALRADAWGVLVAPEWACAGCVGGRGDRGGAARGGARSAGADVAAGAGRVRDRGHGVGRQDDDQGPDRRAGRAAAPGGVQPRQLQHGDRPAPRGARGAGGDGGARARAGHARVRADRGADGDLRARRRPDHEYRPRASRADGLAGGRGPGEGRAAGGDARRRRRGRARGRAAARSLPAAVARGRDLRRGR